MNVYFHFSVAGFSNCYLVGGDEGGDAIIVDPGVINVPLIRTIEDNGYQIGSVLLTHTHGSHVKGLTTLLKIYDAAVFANADEVSGIRCTRIVDKAVFHTCGFDVIPMAVAGHSADSVVYRIDSLLFSGDVLGPGRIGSAPNAFARALLVDAVKKRLCTLPGDALVFPGHGAPSTIEAERRINPLLADSR